MAYREFERNYIRCVQVCFYSEVILRLHVPEACFPLQTAEIRHFVIGFLAVADSKLHPKLQQKKLHTINMAERIYRSGKVWKFNQSTYLLVPWITYPWR